MSDIVRDTRAKARKGDTLAMIQLSDWYYIGMEGLDKSRIKSFEWLLKAAEHGDPAAQNGVGSRYESGDGVAKDTGKAFDWYQKAFKGGDAGACFNIGIMLEEGTVMEKDLAFAAKFYEEGAARGSAICQYRLGYKLLHGDGVKQDVPRAMEFLEFSGQAGYGSAYETLGEIHLMGEHVPKNAEKAYDCFLRALSYFDTDIIVATGNVPVVFALCLLTGTGCERDRKTALDVLNKAAEAGNPIAEQVVRDNIVRDPLVYMLFSPETFEKPPQDGWDISKLVMSKFA